MADNIMRENDIECYYLEDHLRRLVAPHALASWIMMQTKEAIVLDT
jgi:hypothetical protein